ncbi:AIR synthase family protein [Stygiolobus caldivivus]|uniref:AIR synthase n=1 Tax=Stygiolobus caldivivus TaxID=2824673 RepID=A0A8D5U486_9CREN|nr:AIR synthase family protein [Stygiolobus caldivivus]BCU68974.1 AIR synthase [Stygiolobus caldivivus]
MRFGKISIETFLNEIPHESCVVCPGVGEDDAYIESQGKYLVIHSDPITEAGQDAGFLSVTVACNDVNMKGIPCKWVTTVLLLKSEDSLRPVLNGISEACRLLKCDVIGGHTEVTQGLNRDIVVTTAFSFSDRVLKVSDSQSGDYVLVFGTAGIEGSWILANEFEGELLRRGVSRKTINSAKGFKYLIPVQEKAIKVKDYVIAMHDATEGGIYQALLEVAKASGLTLKVDYEIPVAEETLEISRAMGVNPYQLISSGSFIAVARGEENIEKLKSLGGKVIGKLKGEGPKLVIKDKVYTEDFEEELVRVESGHYGRG